MRSEAEIRKQVTARLWRLGLFVVDGGLWLAAVFILSQIMPSGGFGQFRGLIVLLMLGWTVLLGLHTLWVLGVELREYLVRRAVEREREFYMLHGDYEKSKRDEAIPRLSDDGELIDFSVWGSEQEVVNREQRS